MNNIKSILVALVCTLLVACGGHGYEGEYKFASSGEDDLLSGFTELLAGDQIIVIGENYIDNDGVRDEYDEIFVRESGSKQYLIFVANGQEESWQILDDKTLMQDAGLMKITIRRID